MANYFTADTHFGHDRITEIRNFISTEEHDNYVLENINSTVGINDRLYILGDFGWPNPEKYFSDIKCKNKHLIIGNHDTAKVGKLFFTVQDTCIIKIRDIKCFLSHYPHAYWPMSNRGSFHLYGHVHGKYESLLDNLFPGRRSIDVGLDNSLRVLGKMKPFSEDWIYEHLISKPGHELLT